MGFLASHTLPALEFSQQTWCVRNEGYIYTDIAVVSESDAGMAFSQVSTTLGLVKCENTASPPPRTANTLED